MDFDFIFVLIKNNLEILIIFVWCLANWNKYDCSYMYLVDLRVMTVLQCIQLSTTGVKCLYSNVNVCTRMCCCPYPKEWKSHPERDVYPAHSGSVSKCYRPNFGTENFPY